MALRYSPRSILTTFAYELNRAGYDKTKIPVPANRLELYPKDMLIMMILDNLDKFSKQTNTESFSQFFITKAKKKFIQKPLIAKACQSFEMSLETHSKFYEECIFFQYLLNIEENREIAKFYNRARKILMSNHYGDGMYHDAETTNLDLEQWVNVANRVFTEYESPKSSERINRALISKAIAVSKHNVRQTIDAVSFLEQCVLEFMKITGRDEGIREGSPFLRANSIDKVESIVNNILEVKEKEKKEDGPTTSKNVPSAASRMCVLDKLGLSFDVEDVRRAKTPNPRRGREKDHASTYDNNDFGASDMSGFFDLKSTAPNSKFTTANKTNYGYKSPIRNLRGMRDTSFGYRDHSYEVAKKAALEYHNKPESNIGDVYLQLAKLSQKHDDLVDFTINMQKNVLSLIEKLKDTRSGVLADKEVKNILHNISEYNNYEKEHLQKFIGKDKQDVEDFEEPSMKNLGQNNFRIYNN